MPQIAGFRGVVAGARDPVRAVYRYHQTFDDPGARRTLTRKALICAVRLAPWGEGAIRRHEPGTAAGKAAALAELRAEKAQRMPIFAGYRDAATEADRLFKKAEVEPATVTQTSDASVHKLWRVGSAEVMGALRHLFAPKKLQILDGVDRYEALLAYQAELGQLLQNASPNYAMMCLTNLEDPALVVAPRHRAIQTAKTSAEVLAAARPYFIIEKLAGAAKDPAKLVAALGETVAHQPAFVAAWAGEADAWKLTLSPDVTPTGIGIDVHRALQKLAPVVVDTMFVDRLLGGSVVATPTDVATTLASKADVVAIVRPTPIDQIAHVGELGQLLPVGSTAFHPPIASLVSAVIDADEDLQ